MRADGPFPPSPQGEPLWLPSGFASGFRIGKVVEPSRGQLISDQVLRGDDMNRNIVDLRLDSSRPGFVERHSVDLLQDVDAQGWLANLEDSPWILAEVGRQTPFRGAPRAARAR